VFDYVCTGVVVWSGVVDGVGVGSGCVCIAAGVVSVVVDGVGVGSGYV